MYVCVELAFLYSAGCFFYFPGLFVYPPPSLEMCSFRIIFFFSLDRKHLLTTNTVEPYVLFFFLSVFLFMFFFCFFVFLCEGDFQIEKQCLAITSENSIAPENNSHTKAPSFTQSQ